MKALLICPSDRSAVAALASAQPLACAPILGKPLLEYWLEYFARLGTQELAVLAADRPNAIRRLVGDGRRWGLRIDVFPERRELTAEEARGKYRRGLTPGWLPEPRDVAIADHLPDLPDRPLFNDYADWFGTLLDWLPRSVTPDRIGIRLIAPEIWVGLRAHIHPSARLQAPCWLGAGVRVGPHSVIGPGAVLEDRAFVDGRAVIRHSQVGPDTFVGSLTEIRNSIAWGNVLVQWETGSALPVRDPFVLSHLRPGRRLSSSWAGRLAAILVLAVTAPAALGVAAAAACRGGQVFRRRIAVEPRSVPTGGPVRTIAFHELAAAHGLLRRWPQLWKIVCGEFSWLGNPPLHPDQAAQLENELERLWISAPIGLFTLADAAGCSEQFDEEACAHAAYYAVHSSRRLDFGILWRSLLGFKAPWAHAHRGESFFSLWPAAFSKPKNMTESET